DAVLFSLEASRLVSPCHRLLLRLVLSGVVLFALGAGRAAGQAAPDRFDPEAWLRQRHLGRLSVRTPQSGKKLQPLAARTLDEWKRERRLYEKALWELIGPWPRQRPPLRVRVLETKTTAKWTRYQVAFQSLPSRAAYASEIRAWLFVPRDRPGQ